MDRRCRSIFATVMQAQSKARIMRWGNILIYSACAALVYAYPAQHWRLKLQECFLEWFGDAFLADGCLSLASTLLLFWLIHFSGARSGHFRRAIWLSYPSLLTAVVLGCWFAPLISGIPTGSLQTEPVPFFSAFSTSLVFILLCTLYVHGRQTLRNWLKSESAVPVENPAASLGEGKISDETFLAWLSREQPVEELNHDLFDRRFVAERLLQRLNREGENTIALQGDYGSGKSSVVAMTKKLAKQQQKPLIFVQVSCWGFESASKAQEELLNQLLRELGEVLDCFAIRSVPERYLEAMADHGGWLKSVAKVGTGSKTPLEQLQEISPLLTAIGHRVVIFIDDVDRNGSVFDSSLIQALLSQFRVVKEVSFVLSISPNQQIDFMKLCEFVEILPKLDDRQILSIVNRVREHMLRNHPAGILIDYPEELIVGRHAYEHLHSSIGYAFQLPIILCSLLHNPRCLKHSLRRANEAWERLHGEVNVDDLIGISVLRTVAPAAFSFYTRNKLLFPRKSNSILHAQKADDTPIFKKISDEWISICQKADFDFLNIAWLMAKLDKQSCKVLGVPEYAPAKTQSISDETRGMVYFRRLINEATDSGEIADQSILELLQSIPSDKDSIKKIAHKITASKFASDIFEQFAPSFDMDQHLLSLLTEIHDLIFKHPEVTINAGFSTVVHLTKSRIIHGGILGFDKWLEQECARCIPEDMNLLATLSEEWRTQSDTWPKVRKVITENLKKEWEKIPPKQMAGGFTPNSPTTLSYLVFIDGSSALNWQWLGPILHRAVREEPQIMIPQLVHALREKPLVVSSSNAYKVSEETLNAWFPRHRHEIMSLIAEGFQIDQNLETWDRQLIQIGIAKAKEWMLQNENKDPVVKRKAKTRQ